MTKSELIEVIARKQKHLPAKDVELVVKHLLDLMSDSLAKGQRIEIRGFGSFSLHYRPPRIGRNPKTGEEVPIHPRRVLTFRPSHLMKDRVAAGGPHHRDPHAGEPSDHVLDGGVAVDLVVIVQGLFETDRDGLEVQRRSTRLTGPRCSAVHRVEDGAAGSYSPAITFIGESHIEEQASGAA